MFYVMLGGRISFKRIAALIQYSKQKHTMGYIGKRPNIVLVNTGMVLYYTRTTTKSFIKIVEK